MLYAPTDTSTFHLTVPLSAYPLAFPEALASEAILPTSRLATDRLLRVDARRALTGLHRSWFSFVVGRRIPLSAGILRGYLRHRQQFAALSIRSLLGRPYNSRRPVQHDDGSNVDSYSYPYPTVLDGIPGRIPSYRLLSPLHTERWSSRPHGGYAFTSAPEGWELHPHENQVVQPAGYAPTVCPLIPRPTPPVSSKRVARCRY